MENDGELIIFGTLLPQFAEDEIPTKKPQTIADQIAVDANGKRRFHGAFTGGFSAGFWNTVGSLEGWKPKSFKSSRGEKANIHSQTPNDFMDDEDVGEFGIAPHRIQTTEEFTDNKLSNKKTRISLESDGPIRGNPVKELFLAPIQGKACISLLRKMGWKDEDGFRGYTVTKRKRKHEKSQSLLPTIDNGSCNDDVKVYNCDMGPMRKITFNIDDEGTDTSNDDDEDNETIQFNEKKPELRINRFGLGYVGLTKNYSSQLPNTVQPINLFVELEAAEKRKKLPISGQAFGVGAFEDDDDDIYAKEDLSSYDFTLVHEKRVNESTKSKSLQMQKKASKIVGVSLASSSSANKKPKKIYTIDVPEVFQPTNWTERKTRFGPMTEQNKESLAKIKVVNLNADTRRITLIGNDNKSMKDKEQLNNKKEIPVEKIQKDYGKLLADKIAFDRFVSEKDIGNSVQQTIEIPPEKPPEAVSENNKLILKRTRTHWEPSKKLCQKMNVAEPITGFKKSQNKTFLFFENVAKANKNRQRTEMDLVQSKEKDLLDEQNGIGGLITIKTINKTQNSEIKNIIIQPAIDMNQENIPKLTASDISISIKQRTTKSIKKSELELKAESEKDKHPSEKKDLFKSIFSSSEDDSDDEKQIEKEKIVDETIMAEKEKIKIELSKINDSLPIKEQTDPIISNKPAIIQPIVNTSDKLLSMLSDPLIFKSTASRNRENKLKDQHTLNEDKNLNSKEHTFNDPLVYGPPLPATINKTSTIATAEPSQSLDQSQQQINVETSSDDDEWIDKSERKKRKHKEHKHKKNKRHKKHKSKK